MKKCLCLILSIVIAVSLCSCGENDAGGIVASETEVVYGGVLKLSMGASDTLNPLLAKPKTVRDALFAVYEPLIAVTADLELRPVLAEEWSFNSDATALTVKLRENVLWHDGTELTAKDVVYSVNTVKGNPDSPYSHLLRYVSAAAETGRYSVTLNLSRSYSQLLYSLCFPIIPLGAGSLDSAAIGTGAFMFESYSPGQSLSLVSFDGYRDGRAAFDKIEFGIVKENITMASAFSTGVTSAVQSSVYGSGEFAVRDKYEVRRACGAAFEYLGMNRSNPIFSSAAVRSAMSSALNREEIASGGYGSLAVAANLPMHPRALRYSPSLSLVDFNAAGAKEALFYDGWTEDADGVLTAKKTFGYVDGDGNAATGEQNLRLSFSLLVNRENPRRTAAASIIASMLGECGFSVTVDEVSFEEYAERIGNGSFDVYLGGTDIGNLYDLEFLLGTDGELNSFGFRSEYMDKALAALAAASDDEAFTNACSIVQEVFSREQPIIGVAFLDDSVIMSKNIAGGTSPLFMSPFGNVGKWFFNK